MGNSVGKALKVDICTSSAIKGKYAKVCVEVDLARPLKPNLMVYGKRYSVEYEGLTRICFTCGQYGHRATKCSRNKQSVAELKQKERSSSETSKQHNTNANPFDPWMMSAHVRRRQEQQQRRLQHRAKISDANRAMKAHIERELQSGRERRPNVIGDPKINNGTRTQFIARDQQQRKAATLEEATDTELMGSKSKFTILRDVAEEDDVSNNLETLKKAIREVPGPSNQHGPVHEKRQGKGGGPKAKAPGNKAGPRNQPNGGNPTKSQDPQEEMHNISNKAGPLTVIGESHLNVMKQGATTKLVGAHTGHQAHMTSQMEGSNPKER